MDEQQMVTVRKTYKYKLVPTAEQEQAMEFVVRRCRELYNAGLQERCDAWQKCGVSISAASQSAQLPAIKEVRPEYRDVHSQVLQDVLTRLDRTYQAFFRRIQRGEKAGLPALPRRHPLPLFHLQAVWQRGHSGQRLPGALQDRTRRGALVSAP